MFINEAIEIARNIEYYWDSSDLETKLKLQKTVFPKGLVRALLRKAQTATRSSLFLVDKNIELSNLIWEGLLIITSLNEQTHDQFYHLWF